MIISLKNCFRQQPGEISKNLKSYQAVAEIPFRLVNNL